MKNLGYTPPDSIIVVKYLEKDFDNFQVRYLVYFDRISKLKYFQLSLKNLTLNEDWKILKQEVVPVAMMITRNQVKLFDFCSISNHLMVLNNHEGLIAVYNSYGEKQKEVSLESLGIPFPPSFLPPYRDLNLFYDSVSGKAYISSFRKNIGLFEISWKQVDGKYYIKSIEKFKDDSNPLYTFVFDNWYYYSLFEKNEYLIYRRRIN